MTAHSEQIEGAIQASATEALRRMPERQRVHLSLTAMLDTNDPNLAGALQFAAAQIEQRACDLLRGSYGHG